MNDIILKNIAAHRLFQQHIDEPIYKIKRPIHIHSNHANRQGSQEPNIELKMMKKERYSEIRQKRYENRQKSGIMLQRSQRNGEGGSEGNNKNNLSNSIDRNKESFLNIPVCPIKIKKGNHSRSITKIDFNHLSHQKRDQSFHKLNTTEPLNNNLAYNIATTTLKKILTKSSSSKGRMPSYIINPEQLLKAHKQTQLFQLKKKIILRMNRDKERQVYQQAMNHIFQMAKINYLHRKEQPLIPGELGINKINISKRGYKQEWIDKIKRLKKSAIDNRQEQSIPKMSQRPIPQKTKRKFLIARTKTDNRLSRNGSRNRTQIFQRSDFQRQFLQKSFQPWEYESVSSKFFQ